eukprot:1157880-Pelagomonas_calceolata.AAC.5
MAALLASSDSELATEKGTLPSNQIIPLLLHSSFKEYEQKSHAGSESTPCVKQGKGDTFTLKAMNLPQQVVFKKLNVGLLGFWRHMAPGHQGDECLSFYNGASG